MKQSPENAPDGKSQEKVKGEDPRIGVSPSQMFTKYIGENEYARDGAEDGDPETKALDLRDLGRVEVIAVDRDVC
jgi:hypothetical protein